MNADSVSRRRFLQTAGVAAACMPISAPGASGAETHPANLEAAREVGLSKWGLDTPALCVDLDALETNLVPRSEKHLVL